MKTYENFKKVLVDDILKITMPGLKDTKILISEDKTDGKVFEAIHMKFWFDNYNFCIKQSLNKIYAAYVKTGDYQTIFSIIRKQIFSECEKGKRCTDISLSDDIKHRVFFQLANEKNPELNNMSYRQWNGMALQYRILLDIQDDVMTSLPISKEYAVKHHLSEEDLFALSMVNTPVLFPVRVDFWREMYILTNQGLSHGAAVILYPGLLKRLSEHLNDDLCLLPASVNEIIALPASLVDREYMLMGVREVNNDHFSPEKILSNNLFYYDKNKDSVEIWK